MSDYVDRRAEEYKKEIQSNNWNQEDFQTVIKTLLPRLVDGTTHACLSTLCVHMISKNNLTENDVEYIKSERTRFERNTVFYTSIATKSITNVLPFLLSALEDNASGRLAELILNKLQKIGKDTSVTEGWNYSTNKVLGCGSFGLVISATNTIDQLTYAIKVIPNRKVLLGDTKDILRELRNQAKLDHPNVVRYHSSDRFSLSTNKLKEILQWNYATNISHYTREFFGACFDSAGKGLVTGFIIKMELCGETLREWLNKLLEDNDKPKFYFCKTIAQSIADGLCYIHSNELIHRDLKPSNIYFAKVNFGLPVKIGDFGLSKHIKIYEDQTMSIATWNSQYRAPEMEEECKDGKVKYGNHVDWFSFGLILSEIFDPTKENNLMDKFGKIKYLRKTGSIIENIFWLNSLILQLTEKEPNKRIKFGEFSKEMPIKFSLTYRGEIHHQSISYPKTVKGKMQNLFYATIKKYCTKIRASRMTLANKQNNVANPTNSVEHSFNIKRTKLIIGGFLKMYTIWIIVFFVFLLVILLLCWAFFHTVPTISQFFTFPGHPPEWGGKLEPPKTPEKVIEGLIKNVPINNVITEAPRECYGKGEHCFSDRDCCDGVCELSGREGICGRFWG